MTNEHIISEKKVGTRLDKLLTEINQTYSRGEIQSWIKEKYVLVNNEHQKANYKCKLDDKITWDIPIEQPIEIKAEQIPLSILYEDEFLLVVNKPKGMLVHPTLTETSHTRSEEHTSELQSRGQLVCR